MPHVGIGMNSALYRYKRSKKRDRRRRKSSVPQHVVDSLIEAISSEIGYHPGRKVGIRDEPTKTR